MTEIVEDGDLEFNNSQRIFIKEADADGSYSNGSVFLRTNNNETTTSDLNATFSKFRLFMNADNGASRELVLGFSDETSDSFDYGYDARIESFKNDDLSLVMDDLPMVIQAYSSITTNKVIPLLFKASTDQSFTIRIGYF